MKHKPIIVLLTVLILVAGAIVAMFQGITVDDFDRKTIIATRVVDLTVYWDDGYVDVWWNGQVD
jgi:hypothetical protein